MNRKKELFQLRCTLLYLNIQIAKFLAQGDATDEIKELKRQAASVAAEIKAYEQDLHPNKIDGKPLNHHHDGTGDHLPSFELIGHAKASKEKNPQ